MAEKVTAEDFYVAFTAGAMKADTSDAPEELKEKWTVVLHDRAAINVKKVLVVTVNYV